MTSFAVVILAHSDPGHLRRLVHALEDVPIFLHCDAKTPGPLYRRMVDNLPSRVTSCVRLRTNLASWSLVEAELSALRLAVAKTSSEHVAVLSGADYPLLSMHELSSELGRWEGSSWFWNVPLPHPPWSTARNPDGGLWRVQHRFWTWRHQTVFWRGIPLRWPVRRKIPPGLTLRAGSHWKIYSRHHVELLLDVADNRPDLVQFWRSTLVPEESFAASVLGSAAIVGSQALPACFDDAWYIDWRNEAPGHPKWLTLADFDDLSEARSAESTRPEVAYGNVGRTLHRKLFARKFSTYVDRDVVDRIDSELRN